MASASEPLATVAFGRFRLLPHRRELLADGRPVELGGRAFDVLMALIEAREAVLAKDALMARVWPDHEENNLHAQISALRKAFGAECELIRTIAGRGYQFTGEIRILSASPDGCFPTCRHRTGISSPMRPSQALLYFKPLAATYSTARARIFTRHSLDSGW